MTTVELARTSSTGTIDSDPVHIAASCCPPYVRTLCGRPIPPDDVVVCGAECVVCLSLEANGPGCPNCDIA